MYSYLATPIGRTGCCTDVSIVIPTKNRCRQLAATLRRVEDLDLPDDVGLEVIVVDNGSTDQTEAVVRGYAAASRYPVRYVHEPRAGRGCALNAGIAVARGALVSFLDDDVYPRPDWLERVWEEFQADPDLLALASRVELANPLDLPLMVVTGDKRMQVRSFLDADGSFGGCGVYRREVFPAVGWFDPDFGTGGRFRAEEDMDFYYRVWHLAECTRWKMVYTPAAVLYHDHGRRTVAAKRALLRTYNFGIGAFYAKHFFAGDGYTLRLLRWKLAARTRWMLRGHEWGDTTRADFWLLAGFASYARLWLQRRFTGTVADGERAQYSAEPGAPAPASGGRPGLSSASRAGESGL